MKLKLLGLAFAFITAVQGVSAVVNQTTPVALAPQAQEARAAHVAAALLSRYHYKAMPLDEALSGRIFDQYLKTLDPEKTFFVQSDIDQLAKRRTKLGSDMVKDDLSAPFAIFNLYIKRATERLTYARTLLKTGFDFQKSESYQFSRQKQAWPKDEAEVRELWRKRVKSDWLRLRLAGKDDKSVIEVLDKRYATMLKRMARINNEDAFQTYMNAYTMAIEPHTNYMAPRAAADFDISMSLSLVGIGAILTELDDYTTIRELVPGGPASLSGQLSMGDRILGVAQGESGPMIDIMGNRLDDSVAMIRGALDTVVRLDVLPAGAGPDGKHKLVTLVRKPISLKEQEAKSSVQEVPDGKLTRKIGVITLPSFYEDFAAKQRGDTAYKSASRDVALQIEELKSKKVDSILVDLRNNGGGSLTEAVSLTGLFIGKGPVVQVRNANGRVELEQSTQANAVWNGPLGVLINRSSASASEIFAAAIQDYGRGMIIGEPSFGKGTVQTMVDLDRMVDNKKPQFGELKMTIAQFFRINGGTTQLRGVTPDISFPSSFDAGEFGESSFDNALAWTQIKAASYTPKADLKRLFPALVAQHDERIKNDKDFQYLLEDIAQFNAQRKRNEVSLNEAERRKERATLEARLAARKPATDSGKGAQKDAVSDPLLRDDGLQANERNLATELADEKARKNDKDIFLMEAVHILADEVGLRGSSLKLAARAKTAPSLTE
ncbi:tail-specific protease [Rhodoferax lithotrophicus]|uniref:Tail-specific protease n=1 Tax=Rhodoferax lithotrophicus TaxID=2798804 RepID=A0ABN6D8A8_9BURK|nr:carboxy terminal-processing peptidase [Rhodoferax sp. MIZ03]BCO28262.1 tail-specific protease [Rhodoferax sp. MIZ03]